jgi:hypothetical protein
MVSPAFLCRIPRGLIRASVNQGDSQELVVYAVDFGGQPTFRPVISDRPMKLPAPRTVLSKIQRYTQRNRVLRYQRASEIHTSLLNYIIIRNIIAYLDEL